MAADWNEPGAGKAREAAHQSEVADREHRVDAVPVLGQTHRPDEDRLRPGAEEPGEALHLGARGAARALEIAPGSSPQRRLDGGEILGGALDEALRDAAGQVEESLHRPVEEGEVAAGIDGEPVLGQVGAEDRARRDRRYPVALEARLAIRVDDRDLGSALAREVEVLDRHWLVVRHVRAEEDDQVRVEPVGVGVRRGAESEGAVQRHRRGGVAKAGGGVDVGGAEEAGGLLRHVVRLVGDAARSQEEGRACGVVLANFGQPGRGDVGRFGPADPPEPRLAGAPQHGVAEPAEAAQFRRASCGQSFGVGEHGRIERRHRVQPQQVEPNHAQVDAVHRPVPEPRRSESATVADSVAQDAPRVAALVAVLPRDPGHLQVVARLRLPQAEGGPQAGTHGPIIEEQER